MRSVICKKNTGFRVKFPTRGSVRNLSRDVVGRYIIQGGSVPGFPFLASIIAIFSGAQLFALGIIGEYLSRVYFRSMGRPPSVIRDMIGPNNREDQL